MADNTVYLNPLFFYYTSFLHVVEKRLCLCFAHFVTRVKKKDIKRIQIAILRYKIVKYNTA